MTDTDSAAYRVRNEPDGRFAVVNESDRTIIVCRDAASAEHYAVLLNEAYRAGIRQGTRERA